MSVQHPDRTDVCTWSYILDNEGDEAGACWPDQFQLGVSEIVPGTDGGLALNIYIETTGEVFNAPFVRDSDLTNACWIDVPADAAPTVLIAQSNPGRSVWFGWRWQHADMSVPAGWHAFINSDRSPPTTPSS